VAESIPFDRIADRYDETRGGLPRGRAVADVIGPHLRGERLLEIGVGTGVVAAAFAQLARPVVGVDLSPAMLGRAHERLGAVVARADAMHLPIAGTSVDSVYAVWVLHLVGDPAAVVTEAGRVLRPGGRLVAVGGHPEYTDDDVATYWAALEPLRRRDTKDDMRGWAPAAGFSLIGEDRVESRYEMSPTQFADQLERRTWSILWNLDDATWTEVVQPVIDGVRKLPEPDRPRLRSEYHHVLVFERAAESPG
jgi:SAM-dependent methyltransferase